MQVGCTALHRAASAGQSDICEFLLEEGADIEATDRMGQTPLMHATIGENRQVSTHTSSSCLLFSLLSTVKPCLWAERVYLMSASISSATVAW